MARGLRFAWEQELQSLDFADAPHKRVTVIAVGLVLATYYNVKEECARPAERTLASKAGCKPGTVRSVVEYLESLGLLRVDRRGRGAGAHNTNRYYLILTERGNGSAGDHSLTAETVPQGPVSPSGNGSPETTKRVPTVSKTGPRGTPNSKEQQENSATPSNDTNAELKRQHPDEWAEARRRTDLRIAAGQHIDNPDAYAVPVFGDLIEQKTEKENAMTENTRTDAVIAACNVCNGDGVVLCESDDGKAWGDRCTHNPAEYADVKIATAP